MKRAIFSAMLAATLLIACAEYHQTSPLDHEAVDKVYADFAIAYRKADVSMVHDIYADTAIYLNPGDPIQRGQGSFMKNFETMYANARQDTAQLSIEFKIVNRTPADDKVIDIGYYHFLREKGDEKTAEAVGKFITVLQRQEDGSYKFIADIFNGAPQSAWD